MTSTHMHLAEVIEMAPTPPSPYARELTYRAYPSRPVDTDVTAQTAYRIEDQLAHLWDVQLDPAWAIDTFAPEIGTIRAGDLLNALFDAADEAARAEMLMSGTHAAHDTYCDALWALTRAVRDAVEAGRR